MLAAGELPPGWDWMGSSSSARVARQSPHDIFYKEFLPRGPWEYLKARLRGSRAERARNNSDKLLRAGFNAPRNLCWGSLSRGREYLFTRAVPGEGVTTWLRVRLHERSARHLQQRRQLLRELGTFIGRLHRAGFVHGDLRPSNVLAVMAGERFDFALIDNERTLQGQPPDLRGLKKNLMQLNMLLPSDLTRSDRWRFFQCWRNEMTTLTDQQTRALAADAYRWAMDRLAAKGKL